jgi:hypothetical protein
MTDQIIKLKEKIKEYGNKNFPTGVIYLKDYKKEEVSKDLKEIAIKLVSLLKKEFTLKIETYEDGNINDLYEFCKEKGIKCEIYKGKGFFWGDAYGLEIFSIDKKTFSDNLGKLFMLKFMDFQFLDSESIITITHDGDVRINKKVR